jgi:hypothetical protein
VKGVGGVDGLDVLESAVSSSSDELSFLKYSPAFAPLVRAIDWTPKVALGRDGSRLDLRVGFVWLAFSFGGLYGRGDKRLSSDVDMIETISPTVVEVIYMLCLCKEDRQTMKDE